MGLRDHWVATVADDELRRQFAEPELDEANWEPVTVPGHWRSTSAFSDSDGPILYRTRFDQPAGPDDRRWWLRFDGIFYQGDIWLDGAYLGDTEGYFFPHTFEVTDALRARSEHVLAVEATCSPQTDRTAKRNITGVFQHWDCLDPDWNPGGIWRPVELEETGPVRIRSLVTRCTEATPDRAVLAFTAELDAAEAATAHVRTTVGGVDHGTDHALAAGPNAVEWTVTVDRPRLWWPHALGDANLENVVVEVRLRDDAGSRVSHRRRFQTGLRTVSMHKWIVSVNGERLFVKGTNQGPTRMALADATPKECDADVALAKDAGLDLIRMHGHIGRPETYAAADRAGMLIWQDFPLQWAYARTIRKQASRQAAKMVEQLAHHPSVALWCGHNEPMGLDPTPEALGDPRATAAMGARAFVSQELPTWNKSVLDRAVERAIKRLDDSRPVIRHSGMWPSLPRLDGTDSHLYFGWYWGDERDLPAFAKAWPRQVRFVSEFGAQAVPDSDDFLEPERWPDLDWDRLGHTHGLQLAVMDRFVPRDGSFEEWRRASQEYQATVARRHVEALRRLKYRPTGGFCHFSLADSHPSISWAVVDHERRPKAAYAALREACRPVIVVADRLPETACAGDELAVDIHVVSDIRHDLTGQVDAELRWKGGSASWQFEGDVPADSCVAVGTIRTAVPQAEGELVLELRAQVGDHRPTNIDRTTIQR